MRNIIFLEIFICFYDFDSYLFYFFSFFILLETEKRDFCIKLRKIKFFLFLISLKSFKLTIINNNNNIVPQVYKIAVLVTQIYLKTCFINVNTYFMYFRYFDINFEVNLAKFIFIIRKNIFMQLLFIKCIKMQLWATQFTFYC